MKLTAGEHMKVLFRLASICTLVLLVDLGCRKETKAKDVASNAQQDTMLMRDLAEANKNTAAASSLDNSLNTVRTRKSGSHFRTPNHCADDGQRRTSANYRPALPLARFQLGDADTERSV